jgi:SnoaL-like polyketide cyclase/PEP-CTERM motif-containing protein
MRALALAAMTAALAATPISASADVLQENFSMVVGNDEPISARSTEFSAFDHLRGTLDSVSVSLTGTTNWNALGVGAKLVFSLGSNFDDDQVFIASSPGVQRITVLLAATASQSILFSFLDIGMQNLSLVMDVTDPGGVIDPFTMAGTISYDYTPAVSHIGGGPSPVPEPATWAMMLIGFGGLGYFAIRRQRYEGTHTGKLLGYSGAGKPFVMRSIDIWRVEDGRFVEHWDELNTLDVFIQMGAVSPPRQPS